MIQSRLITACGLLLWLCEGTPAGAANRGATDFDRDIRPILSDKCFACHGPDEKERKAKLRLDRKEDAFKPLKSGASAIVPGDPEKSELITRLTAKDEDDVMPPPKSGKKLTAAQIDLLRRWVAEGAKWQSHWAFTPPVKPALPVVRRPGWEANPIDRFVLARLEKEKLKPSPEADRRTLIRRLSFDLRGLLRFVSYFQDNLATGMAGGRLLLRFGRVG